MKQTNWYKDAIIYQIYPRSFKDSNNDGIGDINGIIEKADYLKNLGINCIWLSPVYDSPQEDNGYDISDYKNIYKPFGTIEDLKHLIEELHKRDIRLIMDLVVNHTSSKHKWFQEALKNPDSKYRNYYYFKKGKGKNFKKPPNNWTGFFGESTWTRVEDSPYYYLHLFAKGQPDLNWENEEVRKEVKDILKFYLNMGVDGFRCDVITLISKKQDFKSRFPKIALTGKDAFVNGPRLHEFLHELYLDVYSNYDCMTVGETVLSTLKEAQDLVLPSREELSMVFNFDHTNVDNYFGIKWIERKFNLKRFKKTYRKRQNGMYQKGWNSLFIENHDQRRSTGRFNTENSKEYRVISAKMLATTYFLMQGTPFIYQGQEIGMTNGDFEKIEDFKDVETYNIYNFEKKVPIFRPILKKSLFRESRDNARTPMQWDNCEYAGFSNSKPWIQVNKNKDYINVEESIKDEDSIYNYYKKLIQIKKDYSIIKTGKYIDLLPHSSNIFAYSRSENNEDFVVFSNFSKKNIKVKSLKKYQNYNLLLSNYLNNDEEIMKPYETRIYYKKGE